MYQTFACEYNLVFWIAPIVAGYRPLPVHFKLQLISCIDVILWLQLVSPFWSVKKVLGYLDIIFYFNVLSAKLGLPETIPTWKIMNNSCIYSVFHRKL